MDIRFMVGLYFKATHSFSLITLVSGFASTSIQLVEQFGIDPNNAFAFWDWVGGRYSGKYAGYFLNLVVNMMFDVPLKTFCSLQRSWSIAFIAPIRVLRC